MNEMGTSLIGQLFDGITEAIGDIQGVILTIAGSVIILMLMIGGYQYIMGQKDAAKKTITAAIIGLVIILLSGIIVAMVNQLF